MLIYLNYFYHFVYVKYHFILIYLLRQCRFVLNIFRSLFCLVCILFTYLFLFVYFRLSDQAQISKARFTDLDPTPLKPKPKTQIFIITKPNSRKAVLAYFCYPTCMNSCIFLSPSPTSRVPSLLPSLYAWKSASHMGCLPRPYRLSSPPLPLQKNPSHLI